MHKKLFVLNRCSLYPNLLTWLSIILTQRKLLVIAGWSLYRIRCKREPVYMFKRLTWSYLKTITCTSLQFHLLGRLMKLIKVKEGPKVPKQKIKLPQIVTPENYHLAVMGLSLMLETDQDEFDLHRATSNVSSTSEHAVLILPVIDKYLATYALILEKSLDLSNMSVAGSIGSTVTPATSSTLDSLTSSLRSLLMRGVNVAKLVESSAVNTLKVLHNLVKHSSHVRQALLLCDHKKIAASKTPGNKNKKTGSGTEDPANSNPAVGKGSKSGKNGSTSSNQGTESSANHKLPSTTARSSQMNPQPSTSKQVWKWQICGKGPGDEEKGHLFKISSQLCTCTCTCLLVAHLQCRRRSLIRSRTWIRNPMATLYYAEHIHIAQTQTLEPYFLFLCKIGIWILSPHPRPSPEM